MRAPDIQHRGYEGDRECHRLYCTYVHYSSTIFFVQGKHKVRRCPAWGPPPSCTTWRWGAPAGLLRWVRVHTLARRSHWRVALGGARGRARGVDAKMRLFFLSVGIQTILRPLQRGADPLPITPGRACQATCGWASPCDPAASGRACGWGGVPRCVLAERRWPARMARGASQGKSLAGQPGWLRTLRQVAHGASHACGLQVDTEENML